ncbi:unnamed protein product [Agarophyton chilense]
MAANLRFRARAKASRLFLPLKRSPRLSLRFLSYVAAVCIVSSLAVAFRQFYFWYHLTYPDVVPSPSSRSASHSLHYAPQRLQRIESSVNLWRHEHRNFPPEQNPPAPSLYATGSERCFSLGLPDAVNRTLHRGDPASFWQMNSRALCYSARPVCLYGRSMRSLLSFEPRGSSRCQVLSVSHEQLHEASDVGLNESCAAFRTHYVGAMYGNEVFYSWKLWQQFVEKKTYTNPRHHAVEWKSQFAIIVPKYNWSYNICHYNRVWNFIMYVIRNLHLFVPDADQVKDIDVFFRSGYKYNQHWHVGIRNSTLPYLQRQVGKTIRVSKLRYDYLRDYQCIQRAILLGREARIDAFPFLNDTPVWRPEQLVSDSHWPVIPRDALWLRNAVLTENSLGSLATSVVDGIEQFDHISLPPRRVGFLERSPRSKRRLTPSGRIWLESTLEELCVKHGMEYRHIHTSAAMSFKEQVNQVQSIGMAVGIHGANMVNSVFMPVGGALFEIFPWRYVRYYYASGGNSGLRYSFHEPERGYERNCSFEEATCFMKYRESVIYLSESDRDLIYKRLENSIMYITALHRAFPDGNIPLRKEGSMYQFG